MPGTQLVQESLAEILDVSRIRVRESIRTLAAEGLVVFEPWTRSGGQRVVAGRDR